MSIENDIPKVIMQTGYSEKYESTTKTEIIEMNPSFQYEYYNDNDCITFLKKNFSEDVLIAFNKLRPGAFKADLFRYCYLYINGGVYIDLDILPKKPLNQLLVKDTDFISALENRPGRHINGIYQGFIACKKGINFLKTAIETIVYYTQINYYPSNEESDIWINILSITGPVLLYNSMNLKKRPLCGTMILDNTSIFLYSFNQDIYDLNNEKIMQNDISFTRSNDYAQLFWEKKVYNDE